MQTLNIEFAMTHFQAFALVFIRASCILYAIPLFGESSTPVRWRILFAATLAATLAWAVGPVAADVTRDTASLAAAMVNEVILGGMFGFIGRMFFDALVMAASLVGFQMGFGTADLIVGDSTTPMNSFTALHRILTVMFFLALDLHHVFLVAIKETLVAAPPGTSLFARESFAALAVSVSAAMFPVAIKLAAPVLVALLFTMAVMGVMARAVPQLNVFTMSFPISFFLGMFVYLAMLPLMPGWLRAYFQDNVDHLVATLRIIKT